MALLLTGILNRADGNSVSCNEGDSVFAVRLGR